MQNDVVFRACQYTASVLLGQSSEKEVKPERSDVTSRLLCNATERVEAAPARDGSLLPLDARPFGLDNSEAAGLPRHPAPSTYFAKLERLQRNL